MIIGFDIAILFILVGLVNDYYKGWNNLSQSETNSQFSISMQKSNFKPVNVHTSLRKL